MTRTTVDLEVITNAVLLACRAPSLHNSQPWRWIVGEGEVDLFYDHSRTVHSTDSSGRQTVIGCGAALGHFRVAMAAAGWNTNVDHLPNPNMLDHLATVDFSPAHYVTAAQRDRADAILRRRTDRMPFDAPTGWASFEPVLLTTFDHTLAKLDVLPDDARPALAEASRLTESLRRYDQYYHDELRWWTQSFNLFEGVPHSALVSEEENARVEVNRQFPAGGLATCTLSHITELAESRDIIENLIGDAGFPQLLIRVGQAPALGETPPPTPRRPLTDVMHIRP